MRVVVGEYFSDFPWAEADPEGREFLELLRDRLQADPPDFLPPEQAVAKINDRYVEVVLTHPKDPQGTIRVLYGDGYLEIEWPFEEVHGYEHPDRVAALIWGALTGRIVETRCWRVGLLASVTVQNLDEPQARRCEWHLPGALLLPIPGGPTRTERRSISFQRTPATGLL